MNVPVPDFVRPPVPAIAPENVVEVLSPPVVSVLLPSATDPAPASEPIASLPPRASVAAFWTVTAAASASTLTPVVESMPADTSTAPLTVLAPPSASVPAPAFVKPVEPARTLVIVVVPVETVNVFLAESAPPSEISPPVTV